MNINPKQFFQAQAGSVWAPVLKAGTNTLADQSREAVASHELTGSQVVSLASSWAAANGQLEASKQSDGYVNADERAGLFHTLQGLNAQLQGFKSL